MVYCFYETYAHIPAGGGVPLHRRVGPGRGKGKRDGVPGHQGPAGGPHPAAARGPGVLRLQAHGQLPGGDPAGSPGLRAGGGRPAGRPSHPRGAGRALFRQRGPGTLRGQCGVELHRPKPLFPGDRGAVGLGRGQKRAGGGGELYPHQLRHR